MGTSTYASLNNHRGIEQSRCDYLESLAYVLIYFLCGTLPWSTKKQCDTIINKKLDSFLNLLSGQPKEFSMFLNYTCKLGFEDKPNYAYVHNLFRDDEPHGSLFVYFHIFAPLVDDHVITSHVTGITQPILTFGDQFRSFLLICDNF
ncbi:hypothetical protein PILCRDRAFT_17288 [Piloderma croceum F 1598]|uniref:Uncharacterized protein n=1 Tax=Piloderma croceum (strain F 1598) TaxID=765440 RepID=A0A0C3ABP6_PILCF|nr:hypothetical protein PILCRDRAFT_17288 [Piloderma croceum F 1598]